MQLHCTLSVLLSRLAWGDTSHRYNVNGHCPLPSSRIRPAKALWSCNPGMLADLHRHFCLWCFTIMFILCRIGSSPASGTQEDSSSGSCRSNACSELLPHCFGFRSVVRLCFQDQNGGFDLDTSVGCMDLLPLFSKLEKPHS